MHREGGGQEKNCTAKHIESPIAPQRVVLKPNLNSERQDTTSSDARTCVDYFDKHGGTYMETCRGEIDFRIQGLLHSAVQEHDHIRKQAVQKLTHQFENHANQEALQADLQQNGAFNPFSEQSKEMIYSMGNMEFFEICESKSECDQTNHLHGTTKVRSASTRKQAGGGTTLSQQQALLFWDGNRLRGGSLLHGHRHQNGSDR